MKKILALISLGILSATLLLALSACTPQHEHTFSEEWTADSDYHWKKCTVIGCTQQGEKAEHTFEQGFDEDGKSVNICTVCNEKNELVSTAPEHEHVFSEKFTASENFHWYSCTTEGCFESSEKEEHKFENPTIEYGDKEITLTYVCEICDYKKVENKEVTTQIENATQWNSAFENFELTNFSMKVFLGNRNSDEEPRHCIVTDDAVYYCIPEGRTFYSEKNADGTYTTYQKNHDIGKFVKLNDTSDTFYVAAHTEPVIRISFANNFDKFVYNAEDGSYRCDTTLDAQFTDFSGKDWNALYCYNSVIRVKDGEIIYIECEYNFNTESEDRSYFIYYNIGSTVLTIPEEVINSAINFDDLDDEHKDSYPDYNAPSDRPNEDNVTNGKDESDEDGKIENTPPVEYPEYDEELGKPEEYPDYEEDVKYPDYDIDLDGDGIPDVYPEHPDYDTDNDGDGISDGEKTEDYPYYDPDYEEETNKPEEYPDKNTSSNNGRPDDSSSSNIGTPDDDKNAETKEDIDPDYSLEEVYPILPPEVTEPEKVEIPSIATGDTTVTNPGVSFEATEIGRK